MIVNKITHCPDFQLKLQEFLTSKSALSKKHKEENPLIDSLQSPEVKLRLTGMLKQTKQNSDPEQPKMVENQHFLQSPKISSQKVNMKTKGRNKFKCSLTDWRNVYSYHQIQSQNSRLMNQTASKLSLCRKVSPIQHTAMNAKKSFSRTVSESFNNKNVTSKLANGFTSQRRQVEGYDPQLQLLNSQRQSALSVMTKSKVKRTTPQAFESNLKNKTFYPKLNEKQCKMASLFRKTHTPFSSTCIHP